MSEPPDHTPGGDDEGPHVPARIPSQLRRLLFEPPGKSRPKREEEAPEGDGAEGAARPSTTPAEGAARPSTTPAEGAARPSTTPTEHPRGPSAAPSGIVALAPLVTSPVRPEVGAPSPPPPEPSSPAAAPVAPPPSSAELPPPPAPAPKVRPQAVEACLDAQVMQSRVVSSPASRAGAQIGRIVPVPKGSVSPDRSLPASRMGPTHEAPREYEPPRPRPRRSRSVLVLVVLVGALVAFGAYLWWRSLPVPPEVARDTTGPVTSAPRVTAAPDTAEVVVAHSTAPTSAATSAPASAALGLDDGVFDEVDLGTEPEDGAEESETAAPAPVDTPAPATAEPKKVAKPKRAAKPKRVAKPKRTAKAKSPKKSYESPTERRAAASALVTEGSKLIFSGKYASAAKIFTRATKLNPTLAKAFRGLGLSYERLGDPASAARAYRRYLKLSPKATDASEIKRRLAGL